jgi:hypothetical protein
MRQHIQRSSAVFSIVAEVETVCKQQGIGRKKCGPHPQYTDSFIIGLIVIKNMLGMNSESSYLRYLQKHHGDVFITLPERSWFNRKCRMLQPICEQLQQQLATILTDLDLKIIDSTPVPVLKSYRGHNSPCFPRGKHTNYGYCASKKEYYYGAKLSLVMTPTGVITDVGVHAANTADINALRDMLESTDVTKLTLIGDKGYYDGELRTTLKRHKGRLVVPDKKRHHSFNTTQDTQLLKKRSIVETINAQLKDHMRIEKTLAQSYQGLLTRLWGALLAFTFGQLHNLRHHRPLLSIKSILI